MRYRLRTLLILMAIGPPLLAWACVIDDVLVRVAVSVVAAGLLTELGARRSGCCSPKGSLMFRFTIRDMLWLTLVVGLLLAWAAQYGLDKAARSSLQEENKWLRWGIKTAGYRLYFEPGIPNPFLEGTYYGDDNGPPDPAAATAAESSQLEPGPELP